jgi:putative ABC transport system substrate-binding protein
MVAFSTQSAQVLLPISESTRIPLVFTAVTDPKAARLTETATVTGISDFMPALPQLKLMKGIVPQLKKLGVIHNPSEVNSVSYLKHVEKEALESIYDWVRAWWRAV